VYLCFPYSSRHKQRLFPYITFIFLITMFCAFYEVGTAYYKHIIYIKLVLQLISAMLILVHKLWYCHLYVWLEIGLWLVIGFIDHLQIVTTSILSAIANSHTLQFTTASAKSFQSAVSSRVVARQRLPTADIPLTLGSRTIPVLHLPASNSNSSQRLNYSSLTNSLTHQPTLHFLVLHCTDSH
jgi:hypothetical protein